MMLAPRVARRVAAVAGLAASALAGAALPAQSPARPLLDSARLRVAQLDGQVAVPGLDSAVEVRRDRWGVPHIYARTQHDLFLAQGYVAAQDRLWQLDMWRRVGEGRVAEVVGARAVERDRFARLLRYRGDPEAEWRSYAPDARAIVTAFVDGVNAYIAQVTGGPDGRRRLPIEFTLLGVDPEPWTVEVPLSRFAALDVSGNARNELARARLVSLVGAARANALWPTNPYRALDPAPGLDLSQVDSNALRPMTEAARPIPYPRSPAAGAGGAPPPPPDADANGSNNWVVSGRLTATGKPIVANDPHRALALPSLRYLTHLVGPGWNVIGAGEPALPGVAAGHNERVGFGFTIVGMDQQDVYVERVRPCGGGRAGRCVFHRGAWVPVRVVVDTIRVRGEAPRVVRLEFTAHGPIVSEDSAMAGVAAVAGAAGERRAYALRFVGSEPGTAAYLASLSLDRAADARTFREAAERWKVPSENLVYADVDGNIGWVAAGLMPVRSWSGLLPVPGDGRYEWRGFLPFASLPHALNPASGFIATANNNVLPPRYPHAINFDFPSPDRALRITDVLRRGSGYTVADFERLQHDEYFARAVALAPVIVAAAGRRGAAGMSADASAAVRALAGWNHVMSRDSLAPLVFAVWSEMLRPRLVAVRLDSASAAARSTLDPDTILRMVTAPDARFGARPAAARDSVVLAALDDAVREIARRLGTDRSRWTWGALHRAPFRHPLADELSLPSVPRGGTSTTVNATGGANYLQTSGASFREILDLADWDNSVAINVPGQSGQPGSEYYDNLLPLWAEGRYFPLVFSRARVEQETAHVLMLTPRR